MVITMIITLTDYLEWFTDNHHIQNLNTRVDGVIVAPIGKDYLIRREMVKE